MREFSTYWPNRCGFTLVEMVIVISIMAILAAVGVTSLVSSNESARDAARATAVYGYSQSLDTFAIRTGKYPDPDSGVPVTYSGVRLWKQGSIGNVVSTYLNGGPLKEDPILSSARYSYSVTSSGTQYELGTIVESDSYESEGKYVAKTLLVGNFNRLVVRSVSAAGTAYIAVPSITLSNLSVIELTSPSFQGRSFTYDGAKNVPATYGATGYSSTGAIPVQPKASARYASGATASQLAAFVIGAYSGSAISTTGSIWHDVATLSAGSQTANDLGNALLTGFATPSAIAEVARASCASFPGYSQAVFEPGSPTLANQPWQNSNNLAPCYYSCRNAWKGLACDQHDGVCGLRNGSVVAGLTATDPQLCDTRYGTLQVGSFSVSGNVYSWSCSGLGPMGVSVSCNATSP